MTTIMHAVRLTQPRYNDLCAAMREAHAKLPRDRFGLAPAAYAGRMTAPQARTAWHLAHARYHGWATHASRFAADHMAREGVTHGLRERELTRDPQIVGISPVIASDGAVWHESCTRRTIWRVALDGSARIWLFDDSADQSAYGGDPRMEWEATADVSPRGVVTVVAARKGDGASRVREAGLWGPDHDPAHLPCVDHPNLAMYFTLIPLPPPPEPRPLRDDAPVRRL